jgi:serine/threonine protein kinase
MSKVVSELQWQVAKDKLSGQPSANNGKMIYRPSDRYLSYTFIQFDDKKPYAVLRKEAGKGEFGQVRFAESEKGTSYAVKVRLDRTTTLAQYKNDDEVAIGKDVGLIIKNGNANHNKLYCLMPNLGQSLAKYLKQPLKMSEQFDIAIKLCHEVSRHHHGLATHSKKKVMHRDIKPANVMINPSTKVIRLTDYGISIYAEPSRYPYQEVGTPYYLPPDSVRNYSYGELDALAIKRCIHMPSQTYINGYGRQSVPSDIPRIFSDKTISQMGLKSYFDTSTRYLTHHSPLQLGALLILAASQKPEYYRRISSDIALQKALHVLYFSGESSQRFIDEIVKKDDLKKRLCNLWPLIDSIDKNYLKEALSNDLIANLLKDVQSLPKKQLKAAIITLNQTSIEVLNTLERVNELRSVIGLKEQERPDIKSSESQILSRPTAAKVKRFVPPTSVKRVNSIESRPKWSNHFAHAKKTPPSTNQQDEQQPSKPKISYKTTSSAYGAFWNDRKVADKPVYAQNIVQLR